MSEVENESAELLNGFNVAYGLAQAGDSGWLGTTAEDAFKQIEDVKARATALKPQGYSTPSVNAAYSRSAVTGDLIRGLRGLDIQTPELQLKALQMKRELFSSYDDNPQAFLGSPSYRLDTYNKGLRFLGDEKLAKAYLGAVLKDMPNFSEQGLRCEPAALETRKRIAEIAELHPEMAEAAKAAKLYPFTAEDKKNLQEHQEIMASSKVKESAKTGKTRRFDFKNVKDKAKDFIKDISGYTTGQKLFAAAKEGAVKGWNEPGAVWKDSFKAMVECFKKNPKTFTASGAAVMFAGAGTMNPALAAAGASIMTAGAISWAVSRVRDKVNLSKDKKETSIETKAPKVKIINGEKRLVLSGSVKNQGR